MALPLQLVLEGRPKAELDQVYGFCVSIGLPVTLGQVGGMYSLGQAVRWQALLRRKGEGKGAGIRCRGCATPCASSRSGASNNSPMSAAMHCSWGLMPLTGRCCWPLRSGRLRRERRATTSPSRWAGPGPCTSLCTCAGAEVGGSVLGCEASLGDSRRARQPSWLPCKGQLEPALLEGCAAVSPQGQLAPRGTYHPFRPPSRRSPRLPCVMLWWRQTGWDKSTWRSRHSMRSGGD